MRTSVALRIVAMSAILIQAGCAQSIDRMQKDIPPGIAIETMLFHRTVWFSCAAEVYKLEETFADKVRSEGLSAVEGASRGAIAPAGAMVDYDLWRPSPADVPDDMSKEAANRFSTRSCLDEKYLPLFDKYAYGEGGYFAESDVGGTAIVAPDEGILIVGGYE